MQTRTTTLKTRLIMILTVLNMKLLQPLQVSLNDKKSTISFMFNNLKTFLNQDLKNVS